MRQGDFDVVLSGWGPDYNDVLTYGDLFSHGICRIAEDTAARTWML